MGFRSEHEKNQNPIEAIQIHNKWLHNTLQRPIIWCASPQATVNQFYALCESVCFCLHACVRAMRAYMYVHVHVWG